MRNALLSFVFVLATAAQCFAANPQNSSYVILWTDGANNFATTRTVTQDGTVGEWFPQDTGWNARNTGAGNKIHNMASAGSGFPFMAGAVNVTAAMSDAAWDAALPGWTRDSSATWAQNCYGYASGKGYWIQAPGFNQLVADDYTVYSTNYCKEGCISKETGDHCKLLETCYADEHLVKKVSQKYACSGVYSKTFAAPGDKFPYDTIYCKK